MTRIIEMSSQNWSKYKPFLVRAMQSEFPKDEQLTESDIAARVLQREAHNGKALHLVHVVEKETHEGHEPVGMIIFHRYATSTSPTSLIEYTATLSQEKSKGYGKELVESAKHVLAGEGVEDIVLETEIVPRIITNRVHTDMDKCYTKKYDHTIYTRGELSKKFKGIDARNMFWERQGFDIIEDLAYCQPNLDPDVHEEYPCQHRVPLDLQIASLKCSGEDLRQVPVERVKAILRALAELNYNLGENTESLLDFELGMTHSGKRVLEVPHFEVVPYTSLIRQPNTELAFTLLDINSKYLQQDASVTEEKRQ